MTDKTNHIYEDTFQVDIKYTYDRKHNKVYDIDSAVKEFNKLIKKLMKQNYGYIYNDNNVFYSFVFMFISNYIQLRFYIRNIYGDRTTYLKTN